jgi:hypothetical protein
MQVRLETWWREQPLDMIYSSKGYPDPRRKDNFGEPMTLICTRPLPMRGTIGGLLDESWSLEVGCINHMKCCLMEFFLEEVQEIDLRKKPTIQATSTF